MRRSAIYKRFDPAGVFFRVERWREVVSVDLIQLSLDPIDCFEIGFRDRKCIKDVDGLDRDRLGCAHADVGLAVRQCGDYLAVSGDLVVNRLFQSPRQLLFADDIVDVDQFVVDGETMTFSVSA